MPYRYFIDSNGVRWRVWDVVPTLVDRRRALRRVAVMKVQHPERRMLPTRRINMTRSRLYFPPSECGWLCFETEGGRFRLRPIPPDWLLGSDEDLERLRRVAEAGRDVET